MFSWKLLAVSVKCSHCLSMYFCLLLQSTSAMLAHSTKCNSLLVHHTKADLNKENIIFNPWKHMYSCRNYFYSLEAHWVFWDGLHFWSSILTSEDCSSFSDFHSAFMSSFGNGGDFFYLQVLNPVSQVRLSPEHSFSTWYLNVAQGKQW